MPNSRARINTDQLPAAGTRIESDDSLNLVTYSIIQQAFQVLYEARNQEAAINSILEMVEQKCNVSRVYIIEDTNYGTFCNNTFEWCNKGIKSEIANLQNVDYSKFMDGNCRYCDLFNENGVFFCPDVATLPPKLYNMFPCCSVRYAMTADLPVMWGLTTVKTNESGHRLRLMR